ncbi:MAG TPA: fatty acid desaturase [Nostocaceae cyanobacterium]|nr:fatty acid desaturase [Nostocaceae cyanobacterium]
MTTTQTIRRPAIPAEWYQPTTLGSVGFILYVLALYAVPAWLSYVVATSFDSLILKIILILPLTILSGYGAQMLGFIGHEGFHKSLHPNKMVSALIGLFFASGVIGYFEMGAMMRHWIHHRYTNQPSDPEIKIQASLTTWWQRLLFARLYLNLYDIKTVVNTALGRPCSFPYIMPFKFATAQRLCWVNFGFSLLWLSLYLAITFYAPLAGLVSIALPMLAVLLISGCQTFIDHGGLADDPFHNSWSRTSPLMRILFAGSNFHLEHHLYPGVPCYKLHKVHQFLQENGTYATTQASIEPSFVRAYINMAAKYNSGTQDSSFDPFEHAVESI